MIKINKTSRFEDVYWRRQAGTMPLPLLSHPSRDENKGDMLSMIPHLRLKLLDNIDKDINDSISIRTMTTELAARRRYSECC
jgi:hypothetical protein